MIEKQMRWMFGSGRAGVWAAAVAMTMGACVAGAQTQFPVPTGNFTTPPAAQLELPAMPAPPPITPNGTVVEDVIARVNDQIITRSEYERAQEELLQAAQQAGATQSDLEQHQKDQLRDMIDQDLLLSKAKELGISGDAETLRWLDDKRKEAHLDSMEALQKEIEKQGMSYEDFKQKVHDGIVSQEVEQEEVGRRLNMTTAQEEAFYAAHKAEFPAVPEQIHLSEILISTPDNATDAQIAEAQTKADAVAAKLKAGTGFAEEAKVASGGPTAAEGGDLGDFKRGQLGQVLEDATFSLPVDGVTAPIRTKQGFVILKVDSHIKGGVPTFQDVKSQVEQGLYNQEMAPALREYLTKARGNAYIDIQAGYVDTGASHKESKPTFAAYVPPAPKKKVLEKQRMEQEKAAQAQATLAEERDRVREKQEEKLADQQKKDGVKNVAMPEKVKKIRKEKIRYGQAPRMSLPSAQTVTATEAGAPLTGQAPGVAMAPTETATLAGPGGAATDDDPLAPKTTEHKGRFSDRERQYEEQHSEAKAKHTTVKAQARPLEASKTEKADESQQHAALGLNGDTAKKKPVDKNAPKERLQDKPKAPTTPDTVPAPTVSPALTSGPGGVSHATRPAPTSDRTTLPPTSQGAPGAMPQGQPIPAATSADPGAPTTTPAPQ